MLAPAPAWAAAALLNFRRLAGNWVADDSARLSSMPNTKGRTDIHSG